jgi:ABC-type multidrug transport system permease subunit
MFSLCLIFCGVLASPDSFPHFWIFMYRVSPFTYLVSGLLSSGLARSYVQCAQNEFVRFDSPQDSTCQQYISDYQSVAGGYLRDPNATSGCEFCSIETTDAFLTRLSVNYDDAWRNFGILWAYVIFNIFAALALYWLVRMPKTKRDKKEAAQSTSGSRVSEVAEKA